jgi:hypothetical protein
MSSRFSVVALDDHQSALDRLETAFEGEYHPFLVVMSEEVDPIDVVNDALAFVQEKDPRVIVLDLKWHAAGQYLDGFRFLREACERHLLTGVTLVVWSEYLSDATHEIDKFNRNVFPKTGARQVRFVSKSRLPSLEELGGL